MPDTRPNLSPARRLDQRLMLIESPGTPKPSKLIDDDFPFDESQLDAIAGLAEEQQMAV